MALPNIKDLEAAYIREGLLNYGRSLDAKRRIASELGISLKALYNKIHRYGLVNFSETKRGRKRKSPDNGSTNVAVGEPQAN